MEKEKKILFKLNPEWMYKEPIDFEYNKYTLLGYLQKCEKSFENLEIYPDFVELSLHLANVQSIIKENTLLLTEKKFESCDDEILLKELYTKKPRKLSVDEEKELVKTVKFSGMRLFDTFNIGKSIWNVAFDNIDVNIKKNKNSLDRLCGFAYYVSKDNKIYVWEYDIINSGIENLNGKTKVKLIFEGEKKGMTLKNILINFSSDDKKESYNELPVFEIKSRQSFPVESTLIPIMKRKILTLVHQSTKLQSSKNI
jgi:hypothetical protein